MSLTKSTGNYINPLSPEFDFPFWISGEFEGTTGILEATIFCEGEIVSEYETTRYLPYVTRRTVNGIELEIQWPEVRNAGAIKEDICNSLMQQGIKFDHLSFITK